MYLLEQHSPYFIDAELTELRDTFQKNITRLILMTIIHLLIILNHLLKMKNYDTY